MKVVHLIKSLNRGGAETLLVEGLRVADRERFAFSYGYFIDRYDGLAHDLRALGAPVHSFGAASERGLLASVPRVVRHLRRVRADVVHAHLPLAGVVARLAGRLAGVPVVYTEHNPTDTFHPATQALSRATWGLQTCAVAISDDVAHAMHRHGGNRAPIRTILNGVDTDRFARADGDRARARARQALGLPEAAPVVVGVGMFRPQKRYDIWLDAARQLLDARPEACFVIAGDGELRAEMEARAASMGLGRAVRFAGVLGDVRPLLAAADVFLMSSEYEGFGLAPVEALSMNVPVVATAVAGLRSVLGPDDGGVLVPFGPDTAAALAREVGALLDAPEQRREMGEQGRRAAVERFGLRRMQRELEALYLEVAADRRPVARVVTS